MNDSNKLKDDQTLQDEAVELEAQADKLLSQLREDNTRFRRSTGALEEELQTGVDSLEEGVNQMDHDLKRAEASADAEAGNQDDE